MVDFREKSEPVVLSLTGNWIWGMGLNGRLFFPAARKLSNRILKPSNAYFKTVLIA